MADINNHEDYLDSRDIQERITELETEITELGSTDNYPDMDESERAKLTEEAEEDLEKLNDLKKQYVDSFGEDSWNFGAQFIKDYYFEDYAREFAEDIGAIGKDNQWPLLHIDWEAASEALQMDYTEFDFDGVIYWAREA